MAIKKKLVHLNVVSSGGQVIFIGLVYFLLYRYLLSKLGIELLGVWSVVLSTSSLATLANFGIADSVVRFVALFVKEKDTEKIKKLIFTASIFLFLLFVAISLIIYPFADLILKAVLPAKYIEAGLTILPYSLLCLTINSVNGVFASVLDGMQKNYIRNLVFIISSLILLGCTYFFVPLYNLKGVAFAQVLQSIFALATCFIIVVFKTRFNPFKWNWSRVIFKQIFNYGMKFQFVSLLAMLNDPITKLLLGKFGGMAFTGYYEMANRVLLQARGVIVSATQSLVPVMVGLPKTEMAAFYKKTFSNVFFFSLAVMGSLALSGRLISFYWIGNYQPIFCNTILVLGLSLMVNMLTGPAYFYYMADGNLNALIKTHLVLGLANLIMGYCLGYFFGGFGVVYGWFGAAIVSSIYILRLFNKAFNLTFRALVGLDDMIYFFSIISLIVISALHLVKGNFKITDTIFLMIALLLSIITIINRKVKLFRIQFR